jgi:hypothetical protein
MNFSKKSDFKKTNSRVALVKLAVQVLNNVTDFDEYLNKTKYMFDGNFFLELYVKEIIIKLGQFIFDGFFKGWKTITR